MSVEEDTELRDLVAQTLEKNGCLAKLRAELRASIFLALDEDIKLNKQQPLQNNKIQSYLKTCEGRALFCLVREFLEFFNLQFTLSVYDPESYLDTIYQYEGRQKIAKDLGLDNNAEPTVPLLQQLLKIAQGKSNILDINLNLNGNVNGSFKDESLENDSTYKKTESNSTQKKSNINIDSKLDSESNKNVLTEKNGNLNATFNLSSPTVTISNIERINFENETNSALSKKVIKEIIREDDTYEDTSSIAEDSEVLTNSDKPLCITEKAIDENIAAASSVKTDNKFTSETENSKSLTRRSEKFKSKASLSYLADLPPLNKPRGNSDILPSLYSKEFKDKSNLKELDKMFDMEAEYEEDFMCSSNELSLNAEYLHASQSKINLLNDQMDILNKNDQKSSRKVTSDLGKPVLKAIQKKCSDSHKNAENGSLSENSLSD